MHTCTCHSIREGSGGISYSLFMLGVLCGYCEGAIADAEAQAEWEALTPAERIAARWSYACTVAMPRRRPGTPNAVDAPPF
ncbi:hypothetical protein [Mycolicibacterium holsaticum]|uniref:Uncharacterized protein n=1 Tax=Mycolicibacterium holsaticum TaxID=152142 RepID=A0A1E3S064_9MYCO|nr:hypothetical protein [Mycolicibacterium holsaticum]ODQ95565.1 hypothetical protein BHQ17_04600 [Mycolicibacterium holsaticum]